MIANFYFARLQNSKPRRKIFIYMLVLLSHRVSIFNNFFFLHFFFVVLNDLVSDVCWDDLDYPCQAY